VRASRRQIAPLVTSPAAASQRKEPRTLGRRTVPADGQSAEV
jgi:hypothetical protein